MALSKAVRPPELELEPSVRFSRLASSLATFFANFPVLTFLSSSEPESESLSLDLLSTSPDTNFFNFLVCSFARKS